MSNKIGESKGSSYVIEVEGNIEMVLVCRLLREQGVPFDTRRSGGVWFINLGDR